MDSPQSSTVVAGYRIDGTLGEGGMGTVYRATQLSLERVVALKVLTAELSADPAFRERFRREGLLQAALDHPHIVTVYEAGETDNRLFLAMRMVEGPTLKELILRRQLDDRRALRLLTQVAEALDAAHAKGLIHRDVKPQNVLVGAGDHAYLADFGLTKAHDDAAMTETGQFVGTIDYISPEQARGEHATARSDVYALTAVLCECLTGQVPYVQGHRGARAAGPPHRAPTASVAGARRTSRPRWTRWSREGMAKDPEDRPASAGELMLKARRALGAVPAALGAAGLHGRDAPAPHRRVPDAGAAHRREERSRRDPPRRGGRGRRRARRRQRPPARRRAADAGTRAAAAPRPRTARDRDRRAPPAAEIRAGGARRGGARGRRRTPARRELGRLRRKRSATRRRRATSNSPSRRLAAARERAHDSGAHVLAAARAGQPGAGAARRAPPAQRLLAGRGERLGTLAAARGRSPPP